MDKRYFVIKENLQIIRKLDPDYQAFGSEVWQYHLNKYSKEKIQKFEEKNGITLPREFAEFIHILGFGAGPVYGVNPEYLLSVDKWEYEETDNYLQPLFDGFIVVAEHGCGIESMIIIDGIHKGEIWKYVNFKLIKISDSYYDWYFKWTESLIQILKGDKQKIKLLSGLL